MDIKNKGKRFWISFAIVVSIVIISIGLASSSFMKTKQASAESTQANEEIVQLESDLAKKDAKLDELKSDLEERDSSITEMEEKLEKAKPWFEMSKKEQDRKIEEEKKKEAAEKEAAEKKAKEEEEAKLAAEEKKKKEQEEKEKQGYDTGITFDELARTPDDYEGKKVKFTGKVVQVMESDGNSVQLRVAVNDDYDQIIYVEYDSDIVESRVLEDDQITLMGISVGLLTYDSTMGGKITIPAIVVDKIE